MNRIREMTRSDVEFAYACTTNEGWAGETPEVFESFLAHDPRGCFVAEYGTKPAGVCVATRYRRCGFIGELVVAKELRGKGIGRMLFERSLKYLQSSGMKTVYLDGDLEAIPFYERMGFRKITRSLRFVGTLRGTRRPGVRQARRADWRRICEIDRELFGDDRAFFIERRLAADPDLCFVSEPAGEVSGFIMARPGVGVLSVGPWAAGKSDDEAFGLLETLASASVAGRLRLGVLEMNSRAVDLVRSTRSFKKGTPSWRMVLGPDERVGFHEDLIAIGSAAKG